MRLRAVVCISILFLPDLATKSIATDVPLVTVGNPGNSADPATGFGAVAYEYRISKFKVTNSQYVDFLNAKGVTDSLGLYNPGMTTDQQTGGITRRGAPGSYGYAVKAGRENQPVSFVSWYDAIRFANWLANGQGQGNTESGSYTLLGNTRTPGNASHIVRNSGATYALPSENEWYKAAYYDPTKNGTEGGYWNYPTRSDEEPHSDQPPGHAAIRSNVANFVRSDGKGNGYDAGYAATGTLNISGAQNYLTDVGAYSSAPSYYGTFEQAGDLWEWNEALFSGGRRGRRGAYWGDSSSFNLSSAAQNTEKPSDENGNIGFRVISIPLAPVEQIHLNSHSGEAPSEK